MPEEDDVDKRVLHENLIPCVVVKEIVVFAKHVQEKRNIKDPEIKIGADGGQVIFYLFIWVDPAEIETRKCVVFFKRKERVESLPILI